MKARSLIAPAVAIITLAGCAHSRPAPESLAQVARPVPVAARRTVAPPAGARATARAPGPRPLYFDFDSAILSDQDRQRLQRAAEQLRRYPAKELLIEGNCDERGTDTYNLALGEDRALAAKRYLSRLGVDPRRVKTLSFGKYRPKYLGHDELSWAKNRRDDLVVEAH